MKSCGLTGAWESGLKGDRHAEQLFQQGADRSLDIITIAEKLVIALYFEGCL